MGTKTMVVTDASFARDVLGSDLPVMVDFWAEWCGPCKRIGPVLEEIAEENADRIMIAKVNVDDNPGTAQWFQVMSVPTMFVFRHGEPVKRIVGAQPKAAILQQLEAYL
jgi:thioredoxin 1